jgi:hypothetical protein
MTIRSILITILLKLLSSDDSRRFQDIEDDRAEQWLAKQYQDQGFHEYCRRRTLQILRTMGTGQKWEDYKMSIGQHFELLSFIEKVGTAYKKLQPKPKTNKKGDENTKT